MEVHGDPHVHHSPIPSASSSWGSGGLPPWRDGLKSRRRGQGQANHGRVSSSAPLLILSISPILIPPRAMAQKFSDGSKVLGSQGASMSSREHPLHEMPGGEGPGTRFASSSAPSVSQEHFLGKFLTVLCL